MSIHNVVENSNETTFRHEPIPLGFKIAITIAQILLIIFVAFFAVTILLIDRNPAIIMMRLNMIMFLITAIAFLVASLIANITQHYQLIKREDGIFCKYGQKVIIIKQPYKIKCRYRKQNWLQKILKCPKKTIIIIYNDEQSIEFDGDDEDENGRRIYKFLTTLYRE